jgi:phosphoglucosamine mutase
LLGYASSVEASIDGRDLRGLRVVVDCANGAATTIAPATLRALGAEVTVLHADPDGTNINAACGSTHPNDLQVAVTELGADAGLAFDGDADRVLAVDGAGGLIDGDQIIAICALDRHVRGALTGDAVVVTVMSNLGFRRAMAAHGIDVVDTAVGDRYVLDALDDHGLHLGGEQSGHIIFLRDHVTGDGLASGLLLCGALQGRRLSEVASVMPRYPQVKENVRVQNKELTPAIRGEVERRNDEWAGAGRVLVRPSGTEPLVRVLVEAEDEAVAAEACASIASLVRRELG